MSGGGDSTCRGAAHASSANGAYTSAIRAFSTITALSGNSASNASRATNAIPTVSALSRVILAFASAAAGLTRGVHDAVQRGLPALVSIQQIRR